MKSVYILSWLSNKQRQVFIAVSFLRLSATTTRFSLQLLKRRDGCKIKNIWILWFTCIFKTPKTTKNYSSSRWAMKFFMILSFLSCITDHHHHHHLHHPDSYKEWYSSSFSLMFLMWVVCCTFLSVVMRFYSQLNSLTDFDSKVGVLLLLNMWPLIIIITFFIFFYVFLLCSVQGSVGVPQHCRTLTRLCWNCVCFQMTQT